MANCCHCFQACGKPHLSCDACKSPIHNKCLDLTDSELRTITSSKSPYIKIVCNQCRSSLDNINEMKLVINSLKTSMDSRLKKIEDFINSSQVEQHLQQENIIQEAVERSLRAKNVILYNVPEGTEDCILANDILECIDLSLVVSPDDVIRVGKINEKKPRPIKLTCKNLETAKLVLRKGSALKNSKFSKIFVNSDKTRQQQEYYKNIKNELNLRKDNGENNITIKYVNGIPKIVQNSRPNTSNLN